MDVTFEQTKGALGSLLLLWAAIEGSAREEVARSGRVLKPAHGIAASLRTWEETVAAARLAPPLRTSLAATLRARLQAQLDIRNGICHGLVGISASDADIPATITWQVNGEQNSITWNELQTSFQWLSTVPRAIEMISNAASEGPGNRLIDSAENRRWWLTEFGLDIA